MAVKKQYRLVYPERAEADADSSHRYGVAEVGLTDVQADRFRRAIANGRARVRSIEPIEQED